MVLRFGWFGLVAALLAPAALLSPVSAQETITPIGAIQGVTPTVDAAKFGSPIVKKVVQVQGVITQLVRTKTNRGEFNHGFFLQNTKDSADNNPATSDGIFVFNAKFPTLRVKGQQGQTYQPKVGDEVMMEGQVTEFHNQTQLTQPWHIKVVREGVNLDAEVPAIDAKPPLKLTEVDAYWEGLEGMRVSIPAGAQAQAGLHEHARSNDWITWIVRADQLPNADSKDAYARRLFRDAHPLDNDPARFDDGNGQRIILGGYGLTWDSETEAERLPAHHTFATLAKPITGGVYYTFEQYRVLPEVIQFEAGADPAKNAPPAPAERASEFSVGVYNVENLYDLRNNPFSQNDMEGEPGEGSIKPPFNYVPTSQAHYEAHVQAIARQIIEDLHAPDIILGQEFENQDIAKLVDGKLVAGTEAHADGRPDTAQDLVLAIKAAGGPDYEVAADPMAGDTRGIVTVFLYRTDRVALGTAEDSPMLGATPPVKYDTAVVTGKDAKLPVRAINAPLPPHMKSEDDELVGGLVLPRATQVALFKVYREKVGEGEPTFVFASNNHLSSRPNQRVAQRIEQARLMAAVMRGIMEAHPGALAMSGGDLNVYPRPDDPFSDKPSDQLGALYDAGLHNLWDTLVEQVPASAYSYVFDGQAQTLDQLFVTPALKAHVGEVRVAHINADYAESEMRDPKANAVRRASDHDALVARFKFDAKK